MNMLSSGFSSPPSKNTATWHMPIGKLQEQQARQARHPSLHRGLKGWVHTHLIDTGDGAELTPTLLTQGTEG